MAPSPGLSGEAKDGARLARGMATGTLVLGAGFGGITTALELRRLAPKEPITLVDAGDSFTMGLVNLWALDGRAKGDEHTRPLSGLEKKGLKVVKAEVTRIDAHRRVVETSAGTIESERLVVALGAKASPDLLPGLPPEARDLWSLAGARAFHDDLARLQGGRVLIVVASMPFKCPPAPYEAAMLTKAHLRSRGVEATVTLVTPEPHPLPVFPPAVGGQLRGVVEGRGVVVRNGLTVAKIEAGAVVLSDGTREAYDALGVVPPHAPPAAIAPMAGPSGWIEVDAHTLATRFPGVWAIGDCTMLKLPIGKPIPKAGVLAESEGLVVAHNLASRIAHKPETASFDGRGTCWIEIGDGLAMEGAGDFFAKPQPTMRPSEPSAVALRAKEAFVADRLREWFG